MGGLALNDGLPRADHHQPCRALRQALRSRYQDTVGDVLGFLASGMGEAELLEDFPQLSHDDVLACLAYAADRERLLLSLTTAA